jgi:hypothetical protein
MEVAMKDESIDSMGFMDVARVVAVPLSKQGYLPARDPKTTRLLIALTWGTTAGSMEAAGLRIPTPRGTVLFGNGAVELNDVRNARLLGFNFPEQAVAFRPDSMRDEIEANRYFVALVAFDFQALWRNHKPRVLWVTRYSIREHRNQFDRSLPEISDYASQFFGQETHGFVVKRVKPGHVDIGPLREIDPDAND